MHDVSLPEFNIFHACIELVDLVIEQRATVVGRRSIKCRRGNFAILMMKIISTTDNKFGYEDTRYHDILVQISVQRAAASISFDCRCFQQETIPFYRA